MPNKSIYPSLAQRVFHELVFDENGKTRFSQKHFPEYIFPEKNQLS